jgi:predicted acylesterase/phospholipase RssA
MANTDRVKRRGFVLTGGGAKGLYEAGVIHAFHVSGMEFDVITGSSIGAMNSIFFAEYQLRRKKLVAEQHLTREQAIAALDGYIKSYLHAWMLLPQKKIVDDSEQGPLGQLKDDLQNFNLDLADMVKIGWWWTDPDRAALPPLAVLPAAVRLVKELVERVGGLGELLRIYRSHQASFFEEAMRTYLRRFNLERSLIPAGNDQGVTRMFTDPIAPLRSEQLESPLTVEAVSSGSRGSAEAAGATGLIDPARTFRDYREAGFEVRLTRANYRTGRLEISTYLSPDDFLRFMESQAWRLNAADPDKIPLGSFRLQLPGNPSALQAALASGRFPGVFAPFPFQDIFPQGQSENELLRGLLENWLDSDPVREALHRAYEARHGTDPATQASWTKLVESWRSSAQIRSFFPRVSDTYVDGGTIDNTPSNSAIDATREWVEAQGVSKLNVNLDLFIIFLSVEPKVDEVDERDPALYQVVNRTLSIQGVAKQTSDAVVVNTINTFGDRGAALGQSLLALLQSTRSLMDGLAPAQRQALEESLLQNARDLKLRGFLGRSSEGILQRLEAWTQDMLDNKLPLRVNEIKVYPEKMPLDTLQFTERLGFSQQNAVEMVAMGCYSTLWALRTYLEQPQNVWDDFDVATLALVRTRMGDDPWPQDPGEQDKLRGSWRCQYTSCVFHAKHCPHGASYKQPQN